MRKTPPDDVDTADLDRYAAELASYDDDDDTQGGKRCDEWVGGNWRDDPGDAQPTADAAPDGEEQRIPLLATPFVWRPPASIPPREWLYGRLLARKFVSATVAAGGAGKSGLVIAESLALASGRNLLNIDHEVHQAAVWLVNGEDPREELERRIAAACLRFGLTQGDLGERLFVDSGREQRFVIAQMTRNGAIIIRPAVDDIAGQLVAHRIAVLVVDPFVSCHEVAENDNSAQDMVIKEWGRVADRANCAVHLVHHSRKQGIDAQATADSARGGKAFTDGCRVVRVINRMTKQEAERAGVENHRSYFRVYADKLNMSPPLDKSEWFHIEGVELGNGDNVGVVMPWTWPDALADTSVHDLRKAQAAVEHGHWRENSQARDWVGKPIAAALGLELGNPAHKDKVKRLLKIWKGTGMFVAVEGMDEKRRPRTFIEVGEPAND